MKKIFIFLYLSLLGFNLSAQCRECEDYTTDLNQKQRLALAKQFAPQLRFDDEANTFPTYADSVFSSSLNRKNCDPEARLELTLGDTKDYTTWENAQGNIPAYYAIQSFEDRYFIDYWWTYYRQYPCEETGKGEHDFDWEHIVIQVKKQKQKFSPISVTYFQHGGWYTRLFHKSSIETLKEHPVSYVAKTAHGNYHFGASNSSEKCMCYYGDSRKVDKKHFLNVWETRQLFEMTCKLPWASWSGYWGTIGKAPFYKVKEKFPKGYAFAKVCRGECESDGRVLGCEQNDFEKDMMLKDIQLGALPLENIKKKSGDDLGCGCD